MVYLREVLDLLKFLVFDILYVVIVVQLVVVTGSGGRHE